MREYDTIKLAKQVRTRRGICYNYPIEIGTVLRIPEARLEFRSEATSAPPAALPGDLMETVFDLALLSGTLSVRNFHRGDRFQPLGMTGHKKIKDLFIEKHVPVSIRSQWPLLVTGTEILWIPGYGRSAAAAVSTKTTAVLHLKVKSI
jgi:tRNA(Ile)-lysidine synthase